MLFGWEGNRGPGVKQWQPTAGFMTKSHVGWLPRDRDQLRAQRSLMEMDATTLRYSSTKWNANDTAVEILTERL